MVTALEQPLLLRACRGEKTARPPVWLMRQAGRYQKSYRDLRAKVSMLELCKSPDLVAQVTAAAVAEIGADGAILFSDLLLPVEPLGLHLEYSAGEGPRITPAVRSPADAATLRFDGAAEALSYVYEAVKASRAALPSAVPLLGFAAAPFTLASYLIEGESARHFTRTKTFMHAEPAAWDRMMDGLARMLADVLNRQIDAGCAAVQVFDSWVGCLSPDDYRARVLPHTKTLFRHLRRDAISIHFGTGTASLLELMDEAGGGVMGLDWRVDMADARRRLGDRPVMGNLDPAALFAPRAEIRRQAALIIEKAGGRGHVFNLGHGVLPETPADNVKFLVECVKNV